jgi:hypothetical protein
MEKQIVEDLVNNLIHVNFGLKGSELVLKIMSKDLNITNNQVMDVIFDMVEDGDLVEVEYILPNHHTSKSFVLPKGTRINIINKVRIK